MTETNTPEAFEYTDRDLPRLYVAGPMTGLPGYTECSCGDTSRTGVVHREDGPCYVEPESEGE